MFSLYLLLGMATMRGALLRGFRRGGISGSASGRARNRIRTMAHKPLARALRRVV